MVDRPNHLEQDKEQESEKLPNRVIRALGMMAAIAKSANNAAGEHVRSYFEFVEVRRGVYVPGEQAETYSLIIGHHRKIDGKYVPIEPDQTKRSDHLLPKDGDVYLRLPEVLDARVRDKIGDYEWAHLQKKTVVDGSGIEHISTIATLSKDPDALKKLSDYNRKKAVDERGVEAGIHRRLFPERMSDGATLILFANLMKETPTSHE